MSSKEKRPKRLRLKPDCRVMGLVRDKVLMPGLYIRGANISDEVFDRLLSDEFAHAVEPLPDRPPQEPLATIKDRPKSEMGIEHLRRKREAEEAAYRERWPAGRPTQTNIL